jgi:hypothetical protein
MKTCPQCQTVNPPQANFCTSCRALLNHVPTHAYCEKGHAIDPNWTECYQCKAERQEAERGSFIGAPPRMPTVIDQSGPAQASRPTVMEGSIRIQRDAVEPPSRPSVPPPPPPPPPAQEPPVRRVTQFAGSAPPQPPVVQASPPATAPAEKKRVRRIVGVLITYTWRPEGQIFPIREGRNLIGRNPDKCDIVVTEDAHLSEVNSHITFRRSFTVGDMVSMSGTDLNGAPVEETYVRLPNYSTIRTGATQWTFIEVQPVTDQPESGGA